MDPNAVINDIRNNYTGENLDLNEATQRVISKQNETLNSALEELSENLYKKEFHFIMELIQNAEDNSYPEGVEPYLKFILSENKLIIQNNEIGFSEENVRALCDIKKSTKKKVDGYVGEKGIGFKSVFKVSESPEIHSNKFHFRFHSSKSKKAKTLGYILPELIEEIPEEIDLNITNIILPFPKKNYKKFNEQLSDIKPDLLLFLKKLKVIYIQNEVEGIKKIFRKKISTKNIVKLTVETIDQWSDVHSEESFYRLFSEVFKVPKKIAVDEREGVDSTNVVIGFKLNKDNDKYSVNSTSDCFVYNFLPINDFNFRFTIQADFILTSNREAIDEAKDWNTWIRDMVIHSIKNSFKALQNTGLWNQYLNYLPRENEISEDFFKGIAKKIIEWSFYAKIMPVKNGKEKQWVKAEQVLYYNKDIRNIYGSDLIHKRTGYYFMHPSASYDEDVHSLLDINKWEWDYDQNCIEDRSWFSSLSKIKREEFYEYLHKKYNDDDDVIDELKNLKILFLKGKQKPESFNDADDGVLWPLSANMNYEFLNSVRFLAHDYRGKTNARQKRIFELFKRIGIKPPAIKSMIREYILSKYAEGNEDNKAGIDLNKYHKEFISFIYRNIKIIKKDASLFRSLKQEIWLYSSNKSFYKPHKLYLDKNYDSKSEWSSFFLKSDVSFLAPGYLERVKNKQSIIKFFHELGFRSEADVKDFITVFNSNNLTQIKRLLIYLNKHWNIYAKSSEVEELISAIQIPIKNELYSPEKLFIRSKRFVSLLKESVKYLPSYINNKQFIKDLSTNQKNIPSETLFELLQEIKEQKKNKIDKSRIYRIYTEFKYDSDIREHFEQDALLYSARDRAWYYPWQCVWSININQFIGSFAEIGSQYSSKLYQFFIRTVGINLNIEIDNILNYLEDISNKEEITSNEKKQVETAIGFIADELNHRKIDPIEISSYTDLSIYPDSNLILHTSDEIYFADSERLFKLFQDYDIPIFSLTKENYGFKNSIVSAASDLNLRLLSQNYEAVYLAPEKLKRDKIRTEDLHFYLGLIGYILNFRSMETFREFDDIFINNLKFKIYYVEKLPIIYKLEGIEVEKDESYFIDEKKIYVNKNKIHDSIRLMADIIVELLDGSTIVKDFIFLVINENHDDLAYYLNMHDIPHPKEDVLTFAKRNRKKLRKQRIIEVDNPEDEIESEHLEDEQSSIDNEDKQQEDDVIKVNQSEFQPETDPDFEVGIEDGDANESHKTSKNFKSNNKRSPKRYQFNPDMGSAKEIGNWGENFVFINLAKELLSEYDGRKSVLDKEKQKLNIFDETGREIVLLENRNINGLSQSSYDLLLKKENITFFIEVKSTTRSGETKFNIEESQWECCRQYQNEFVLIIVRNAGRKSASIERYNNLFKMYLEGKVAIMPERMSLFI